MARARWNVFRIVSLTGVTNRSYEQNRMPFGWVTHSTTDLTTRMALTLWRGDQLLGELWRRIPDPRERPQPPGKPPMLSAVLIPAVDSAALSGVWQVHFQAPTLSLVSQFPVEPDIIAERDRSVAAHQENSGSGALRPLTPDEAAGAPHEVQLTIRDTDGTVFLPSQMRLEEIRYEPALYESALREVPGSALVNGSVWCVFVSFASELEAPASALARPQEQDAARASRGVV